MKHVMTRPPFDPGRIRKVEAKSPPRAGGPLTVSQVTALIREAIEISLPPTLHVLGEISNFKRHSSGHLYFTLKDGFCELSCVTWKSEAAKLKFEPKDGMQVIAVGGIEVFERAGKYQLYVRRIEPRGIGTLELAFRQLCERLAKEGLFDERRKRRLPKFPARIAIVSSPTGAAVADILRTILRRYPAVDLLLYPVPVQGPGAAEAIARAVGRINENAELLGGVDVMIVGRGGGSLEELWAFNEEIVARAIFLSRIPVISAVGHEVDVTISDLVADVRATTPTAAGELAVPVLDDVLSALDALRSRLFRSVRHRSSLADAKLTGLGRRQAFRDPVYFLRHRTQSLDDIVHRLISSLNARLRRSRSAVDRIEPLVRRIAPHAFLLATALRLARLQYRLASAVSERRSRAERQLAIRRDRWKGLVSLLIPGPRAPRITLLHSKMTNGIHRRMEVLSEQVRGRHDKLAALGYESVLARGFSITRTKRGELIRSAAQVRDGQRILTRTFAGQFESEVVNQRQLELFDEP